MQAPHQMIELTDGMTHHQVQGPAGGRPLLLIHGIASWQFVWDPLMPILSEERPVVRFDLFGRGYSARPDRPHDPDLFDRQILELLDGLGIEKVDIFGWSMGGCVGVVFADRHPERVGKLALMSPAGIPTPGLAPVGARLLGVPGLGDVLMGALGPTVWSRLMRRNFTRQDRMAEFAHHMAPMFEDPGYRAALRSTLRHFPFNDFREGFRRVGAQEREIMLLWGTEDQIRPFSTAPKARELLGEHQFVPLEGLGHACHWDDLDRVAEPIRGFFA